MNPEIIPATTPAKTAPIKVETSIKFLLYSYCSTSINVNLSTQNAFELIFNYQIYY